MPASSVKVCIRTRPTASFAQDQIVVGEDNTLSVKVPKSDNPNAQNSWSWKYDAVLHNASQETVYTEHAQPIVQSVLRGYNGTIMCYGQTGAGKTFTQVGSMDFRNRGITPRAISEIFTYIAEHPQYDATVSVSYVEIHNDVLQDLLSTLPREEPLPAEVDLHIFEDRKGETSVKNLTTVPVRSEEEALKMLFEGNANRQVAVHQLNRTSTRGHAIFTLMVRIKSRVDSSGVVTKCKLNLVDLAGSERLKKTDTAGDLRAESMFINKSLSYLEQVVVALSSRGRSHTPYRQSKLTHLLKDSLGGNCKTLLIANVYGELTHIEETISTLQFAARVRLVPNEATVNQDFDAEQLIKRYAIEIQDLKRELAMHDSLAARSRVAYEPYNDAQRTDLLVRLQAFLEAGDADEIQVESVRQMKELLLAMKQVYGKQKTMLETMQTRLANGGGGFGIGGAGGPEAEAGALADGEGLGADGAGRGIALGHAPDGARPAGGMLEPPATLGAGAGADDDGFGATKAAGGFEDRTLGRDEAFSQYKISEGQDINQRLLAAKKQMREARTARGVVARQVNHMKQQMDAIKVRVEYKAAERDQRTDEGEMIIDEEEYSLRMELKETKAQYKKYHDQLSELTKSFASAQEESESARNELLRSFDEWYAENFTEPFEGKSTLNTTLKSSLGGGGGSAASLRNTGEANKSVEGSGEVMDDDEVFEQMRTEKLLSTAPDSLAFVRARQSQRNGLGGNNKTRRR